MRIIFIQTAATDRRTFVEGREIELPDDVARGHIRAGHAVEVAPPPEPKARSKTAAPAAR